MKNNELRVYYNMDAVARHLEEIGGCQEITKYEVIEHYENKPLMTYNFINLQAETGTEFTEKDIMFFDAEETIHEQLSEGMYSTLVGFPESCVKSAYFSIPIKGRVEIRIIFSDGYVDIVAHTCYEVEEDLCANPMLDMDSPEVEEMYRAYYAEPDAYDL